MAKLILIFEDTATDQVISFQSDRNISLDNDFNTLTTAEQLAATALMLLGEFVQKNGADLEYQQTDETSTRGLN